ncbi:MAG: hypothetical protein PUC73_06635 [Lachnospiraceae bacterium]|nr:hypothetical protein [Lachnospiraceae bacterium]
MAAQKKKTSSRTGQGSTKRSTSGGRKNTRRGNARETQGPDIVTIVVVLIAVVLVVVLISKFRNENKDEEAIHPTGEVAATGTDVPDEPTKFPVTEAPVPTSGVTHTPDAEATPEVTAPAEDTGISRTEAEHIVKSIVQLENYSIDLLDDHLMIDGVEYYSFCINNEKGEGMSPLLIVGKKEGTLLCYDMSGVVAPIAKFPVDKTETGNEGGKILTADEAMKVFAGYSGERLGLAKETASYDMTMDDWTTMADGVECYGINLFETVGGKQRFRGTFYVALDGSVVYSKDDVTGEFIKR